ncbi:MAG: hypothetical protein ISS66_16500 [Desulfobacteraceae bacterium]|nr:hypothetical protein [Desulfobacteraceae bacterium]
MTDKGICFVIMPYGDWFDHYYKQIYKNAILNAGLTPKRADELFTASAVINDIWDLTKRAKIVLAELTGKNPNVFYELGLAHALAKPALLITESMDDVPFDLRHLRVISYDKNNEEWGKKLIDDITIALKDTLTAPERSVLPTFFESDDVENLVIADPEKGEISDLKYEMNYLKNTLSQLMRNSHVPIKTKMGRRPPKEEIYKLIRSGIKKSASDSRIIQKLNSLNISLNEAEKLLSQVKIEQQEKG